MIALLALVVLTCVAIAVGGGLLMGPIVPRVTAMLKPLSPDSESRWLRLLALSPLLMAGPASLLVVVVGSGGLWQPHHCDTHGGAHLHLCFSHPPALGTQGWVLLAIPLGFALWRLARFIRGALHTRRLLRTVLMNAQPEQWGHVIPDVRAPVAFTVGITRPLILVSEGLVDALTAPELKVVIAHERAHAARRDLLWRRLICWGSWPWPRGARRALDEAHTLACERACDELAAEAAGGRVQVAQTLLRIARLAAPSPTRLAKLGFAFSEAAVVARVEALLAPSPTQRLPPNPLVLGWLTVVVVFVVASDPIHHAIESLYGFLFM